MPPTFVSADQSHDEPCATQSATVAHNSFDETFLMTLRRILALSLILSAPVLVAAALPPVEPMPTLDAAVLAPPDLLNGTGYTIDASAPVVGYMGQFTLRAPVGSFQAAAYEMLGIRVAELAAIAQLNQLSQTGVFADAL